MLTVSIPNTLIMKSTTMGHCSVLPYRNFVCKKCQGVMHNCPVPWHWFSLQRFKAHCELHSTKQISWLRRKVLERVNKDKHATCPYWLFSLSYSTSSCHEYDYDIHPFPNTSPLSSMQWQYFSPFFQKMPF